MPTQNEPQNRVRRTVNDLIMAEMFLVQATIESATVIGEGFNELGKQIAHSDESGLGSWESISSALQQIADEALEPYTCRFTYFRNLINSEN
jgi:hypothetical protein